MKLEFVWAKKTSNAKPKNNITIGCQISIPSTIMQQIGIGNEDKVDIGFDDINHLVGIRKGSTYRIYKQGYRFMLRAKKNTDKAKKMVGSSPDFTIQDGIIILHLPKEANNGHQ